MAVPKVNLHSAPGPMLGYIFQIERALYWLSKLKADGFVYVETDDDLVIQLASDPSIGKYYEQDKSSVLSKRNPFSNKSVDLWKTLGIWSENIQNNTIDIDNSNLLLVTNKVIGVSLIKRICNARDESDREQAIQELINGAKSSKSQEIKKSLKSILSLSEKNLLDLFRKIEIMDLNYLHDREIMKREIKNELHIPEDIPFNSLYNDLLGWLTDLIVSKWLSGHQAGIKGAELNNYFADLVRRYKSKPFSEQTKEYLPITDTERGVHKKDNFVRQLDWIDLGEEDILIAIDDFIRARWERNRFAIEGNIPSQKDFQKMHDDLFERWVTMQRPVARSCKSGEEKKAKGYDLYWSVINFKAQLANYPTEEYYTTKGAYHLMANEFRIGWHIDWSKLKENECSL